MAQLRQSPSGPVISGVHIGDILIWDGAQWLPGPQSGGLPPGVNPGDVLTWDGIAWIPLPLPPFPPPTPTEFDFIVDSLADLLAVTGPPVGSQLNLPPGSIAVKSRIDLGGWVVNGNIGGNLIMGTGPLATGSQAGFLSDRTGPVIQGPGQQWINLWVGNLDVTQPAAVLGLGSRTTRCTFGGPIGGGPSASGQLVVSTSWSDVGSTITVSGIPAIVGQALWGPISLVGTHCGTGALDFSAGTPSPGRRIQAIGATFAELEVHTPWEGELTLQGCRVPNETAWIGFNRQTPGVNLKGNLAHDNSVLRETNVLESWRAQEEGAQGTNTETGFDAVSLGILNIERPGRYRLEWYGECNSGSAGDDWRFKAGISGTVPDAGWYANVRYESIATEHWMAVAGQIDLELPAGPTPEYVIQFSKATAGGTNVNIRRRRISLTLVEYATP